MIMYMKNLFRIFLLVTLVACKGSQQLANKHVSSATSPNSVKTDTVRPGSKPQPYARVITAKANTQRGLFTVHKVEEKYYFEIADTLFGNDLLIVNRISKAAVGSRPQGIVG